MTRFRLACIAIGGVLIFFAFQGIHMNRAAKPTPREMTCAELVAEGPGDNAHIVLKDFWLCEQAFVYEEENGKWKMIWVPAVARDSDYYRRVREIQDLEGRWADLPAPTNIRVIVKTADAKSPQAVAGKNKEGPIKGLVVNRIESLGSEEKKLLQESYPGIDFDTCWIFQEGRRPMSTAGILGFIIGGLIGLLAGLWPFISRLWRDQEAQHFTMEPAASSPAYGGRPSAASQRPSPPRKRVPSGDAWGP